MTVWEFTNMVYWVKVHRSHVGMEGCEGDRRRIRPERAVSIPSSISFPPDIYDLLKELARKEKVSLAWVVRDAVGRYVDENEERLERE